MEYMFYWNNSLRASKLNDDARLVYNTIRSSGNNGIWTKDLKKKTNLHTIVLNRTLKSLEQKQEIKAVKHVKYPTRKIYMLFSLSPSSEVTGGAWYTDQELDTDFIDSLKAACLKYIMSRVSGVACVCVYVCGCWQGPIEFS